MSRNRKVRILDAAGELLLAFGYRRVTIDVARWAGVGEGTIYLHWASKLELFATVLIRDAAEIVIEQLSAFRVDPAEIRLHRTARVALEELTARDRALPIDHDAVAHAGGLRHYQRDILGTRNLPVHPVT